MDSGDDSDHDHLSLEDIRDRYKSNPNVNRREAHYKIHDNIKQRKPEWKGVLKATRNMSTGLNKVFKTVVKEISQYLPPLGESGSEVSHLIPEPRNFAEVTKLSEDINKPWIKKNIKDIKNLINNQTLLVEYSEKSEPVTPCMDVYKKKFQSDGNLDKLKLQNVVRGDLQTK